jgi:hypothetical protein
MDFPAFAPKGIFLRILAKLPGKFSPDPAPESSYSQRNERLPPS